MKVSGQLHAPTALPPGKNSRYPGDRRLGGPQSRFELILIYVTATLKNNAHRLTHRHTRTCVLAPCELQSFSKTDNKTHNIQMRALDYRSA
jgi:hypothetical protein